MEWSSWEMAIQAKEELQILEIHHPNRFDYLKLELNSFISLLQSQQFSHPHHHIALPSSSHNLVATQGSTCERRKKKEVKSHCGIQEMEERSKRYKHESQRLENRDYSMEMDRVDLVLERAQSCLRKIQELKGSLS